MGRTIPQQSVIHIGVEHSKGKNITKEEAKSWKDADDNDAQTSQIADCEKIEDHG